MTNTPSEGNTAAAPGFWRQNRFGCIAFLLAFVALALTILPLELFQPPKEGTMRGVLRALGGKSGEAMVAYEARMQYFRIAAVSVAIVAAALALIGVARHERRALALAALVVAAVAILWHYILIGIVVAVIVAVVFSVLN